MKGQLTVIDLNECEHNLLVSRKILEKFCNELCNVIEMKPYGKPLIKRFGKNELEGYSAIQLIETSSISVHLDEFENNAFIDIFSCKKFDQHKAEEFSAEFFNAKKIKSRTIMRK